MIIALSFFILTYILMLVIPKYKHYIALISALIFVLLGILSVNKILNEIDFNVLLMIFGTMGKVSLFIESKMPELLSEYIIKKTSNTKWMTVAFAVFAGLVSAFIDNVATVLIIAPIVLIVAKKFKISPVIPVICISIFSNLERAATLTGNTTSLLLASLFVIIGGVKEVGIINLVSKKFLNIGDNPLIMYTLIVFVSVGISAFIDNIPYVATMLPLITTITLSTTINPALLYYGLIIGATLGGNFTPIEASANITAIGLLKKNGYNLNTKDYFKYSIPILLAAVLTNYIVILIIFM